MANTVSMFNIRSIHSECWIEYFREVLNACHTLPFRAWTRHQQNSRPRWRFG